MATSPRTSKNPNSPSSPPIGGNALALHSSVWPAAPPAADSVGVGKRAHYPAKSVRFSIRAAPLPMRSTAARESASPVILASPAPRPPERSPQSPQRIAPRIQKRIREAISKPPFFLAACSDRRKRARAISQTVRRIIPRTSGPSVRCAIGGATRSFAAWPAISISLPTRKQHPHSARQPLPNPAAVDRSRNFNAHEAAAESEG